MDAIDTILRAHDILDSLCGADGECTIGLDLKPINDIAIKLQRLTEHPERLIRITQQYDMETAHDLRLMDEYYFIYKDEKPIIIYNIDRKRTEVVFFPFPEDERGYLSEDYLKRLQQEAFLICDFLTVISRALKGLYSKGKKSDRRHNKPIVITPFIDLLAPNYKSKITPIRRAIECSLNGADEKEVARIMNMLFSLKIIRFPEKEIPCTAYMRTFQHEFNSNVSGDAKIVRNFRYYLAKDFNDAFAKTQEILKEESYKTIYKNLCALK